MKTKTFFAAAAIAFLALAHPSRAAVLLSIDTSNPSAVTITATGNFSSINENNRKTSDGIDLLQFFISSNSFNSTSVSGSLTPSGGGSSSYSQAFQDSYSGSAVDLNLLSGSSSPQNFSTTTPAFTGTATLDLSSYSSALPAAGASGDILDGWKYINSGVVIGKWSVVPEPSTYALFGMGAVVLLRAARRRKTA